MDNRESEDRKRLGKIGKRYWYAGGAMLALSFAALFLPVPEPFGSIRIYDTRLPIVPAILALIGFALFAVAVPKKKKPV